MVSTLRWSCSAALDALCPARRPTAQPNSLQHRMISTACGNASITSLLYEITMKRQNSHGNIKPPSPPFVTQDAKSSVCPTAIFHITSYVHTPHAPEVHMSTHHMHQRSTCPHTTCTRGPHVHTPHAPEVHMSTHHMHQRSTCPHTTCTRGPHVHTPHAPEVHMSTHHIHQRSTCPHTTYTRGPHAHTRPLHDDLTRESPLLS